MESRLAYKTLLALVDGSDDTADRLDMACHLARRHQAHLSVLALSQQFTPYVSAALDGGAAAIDFELINEAKARAQAIAADAKQRIDSHKQLGDVRWASHDTFGLREAVGLQGRHADLIIAGQPIENQFIGVREAAFEGALLSSGRPVLLVPSSWSGAGQFENLVLAWDASQQAARALGAATPLVEQAKTMTVVVVDPEPTHAGFGEEPGADIALHLARHCPKVELDRIPSSGDSIAQALLARTIAASGDLIIMGGYGHSMLRESFFGGVTREIIHQTSVPLLLAH